MKRLWKAVGAKGRRRFRLRTVAAVLCLLALAAPPAAGQEAGRNHAVLIGGLGGSEAYTETFRQYLFDARKALTERFGFAPADVVVLAEPALEGLEFVTGVSSAENIQAQFEALARRVTAADHVYVLLFGHGSYDGERAQLNIPRRDLNDEDYASLQFRLRAERIVFVNTASASGPFVEALAAPGRIVVAATRAGTQRNETVFPRFLVEGLASAAADMDKDGNLSVGELFAYAAEATARSFEAGGHLATEHAVMDDAGTGTGLRLEELRAAGQGNLAAMTYLRRGQAALAAAGAADALARPEELREKEALERSIAELKSQKARLDEDAYYARLEELFVRLARLNDAIEARQ